MYLFAIRSMDGLPRFLLAENLKGDTKTGWFIFYTD